VASLLGWWVARRYFEGAVLNNAADSSETKGAVLCNMRIFAWFRFIILG
jgi:hypothetical protein